MPFAYYARLTRVQQAIYRKSDALAEIRLEDPAALRPLVAALEAALKAEERAATLRATDALVRGLCAAMGLPPVAVEVLAARPHARWGELHGLYTNERGRPPTIQLWMRTAKQKRVVAFRTYLRTLLHEVGHHVDYTGLRLPDSFHTEGFYKRESSLFAQLVPDGRTAMPSIDDRKQLPLAENLARMARTADELAAALEGAPAAALARRPEPESWSATEIVCHLRDAEEYLLLRVWMALTLTEPAFPAPDQERWADDRQYRRSDAGEALTAFRRRRQESLARFRALAPADLERGGTREGLPRTTVADHAAILAWHDDNHLDQLRRALEGKA
ncbi:MAG: DinB family protein [Candidatus Rokubacteria bacterium]|nr:DinB family protein [Candidatus Rokubacteria bacterium]